MKILHSTKTYTVYEVQGLTKPYIAIGLKCYDNVIDVNSLLNCGSSRSKKQQAIFKSVARRFCGLTKKQLEQWVY